MASILPADPTRVPGLVQKRVEARAEAPAGGIVGAPAALGDWVRQGGGVAPTRPCGDCRHWRYRAGQEEVTRISLKLDLNDLGWDKYMALREMGRCAQQEELLAHRLATCPRWEAT